MLSPVRRPLSQAYKYNSLHVNPTDEAEAGDTRVDRLDFGHLASLTLCTHHSSLVRGLSDFLSRSRADQLRVPTLILHSEDDDFVPLGPSVELAGKNPAMVSFVRFTQARHTREWNVDPEKWHRSVQHWLAAVLTTPRPGRS